MLQEAIKNILETKERYRVSQKTSRKHQQKLKGNKKNHVEILQLKNVITNSGWVQQGMGTKAEWKEQRKESMNIKAEQQKLSNPKNMEKIY